VGQPKASSEFSLLLQTNVIETFYQGSRVGGSHVAIRKEHLRERIDNIAEVLYASPFSLDGFAE
jgi:hypothetical protein